MDVQRIAYHEAGHAVGGYLNRRPLLRVSIVETEDAWGTCTYRNWGESFRPDIEVTMRVRDGLERAIITGLAGPEAEAKYIGEPDKELNVGADSDYRAALNCALYVASSAEESEAYLAWLAIRARAMFRHPMKWAAVEAVAAELVERREFSARHAREVIRRGMLAWSRSEAAKRPDVWG
jgi:hypothetical protein